MLIKRLLCVVNTISGVNECMGEEMVYAKSLVQSQKKNPTARQRTNQAKKGILQ